MEESRKVKSSGLPRLVRQVNLRSVTRQMRRMELFSKIDLARQSGISTTTMTKLFVQLQEEGLIEQSPVEDRSFGRPKILFQLSPSLQVAAIVIDVDKTTLCFSNLQGDITSEHHTSFPTESDSAKLFSRIKKQFAVLQKKLAAPCRLIGVCIPGLIEAKSGKSMLNPNMHWLEGFCPAAKISKQLKIPTIIMHEEKALCRAQLRATDEATDYVSMDFSVGVGMSVVTNGEDLSGATGFAGEIGHIIMQPDGKLCGCGNRGCLETIASDRIFQTETGLPMEEALQQLAEGQTNAADAAERVLRAQATGIAAVINIFNPQKIFVYSRLSEAFPNYLQKLRSEVDKRAINLSFSGCTITTTRDGKLKGALLQTIDHLIERAIHKTDRGGVRLKQTGLRKRQGAQPQPAS